MEKELNNINCNSIPYSKLLYWVDRWFVQERAKTLIGRELNEDELCSTQKCIEWGLSSCVFDIIDISIKEAYEDDKKDDDKNE